MTILVLGDQLTRERGPVATHPEEDVLMIEAHGFARRVPYHPHKLILVFSAMRHFRDALAASGRRVRYHVGETFAEGFDAHFAEQPGDTVRVIAPSSHGATERLEALVTDRDGTLEVVENPLFLCSDAQFDRWADGRDPPYRQEAFYRFMRRETGYLMSDGEPVGGQWNYDDANREPPTGDERPPTPPLFDPDDLTADVADWVSTEFDGSYADAPFGGGWADPEPFTWPVTREAALEALTTFVDHRLAAFGPTQDAMLSDHWAMHHSLLSGAMNIGLLHPAEVVEAVIAQAEDDPTVPTNSVEGFVRQVIGWREFMRHIYQRTMPGLARA
ncbi:MAG: cryptochrome/photolyase family protein, partial [Halobacteriales archaeon]|nr:cryptochrome/photolyase family protein [Halobacteriales archaeon]